MNRSFFSAAVMMTLAALMACGGGDSRETVAVTSSALAVPAQAPLPFNPDTGLSWRGTPVELIFADAFASCAYVAPPSSPNAVVTFQEDDYLHYIQGQMDTALCRYPNGSGGWVDHGTTSAQPELRWFDLRNDSKCNVDSSTKASASAQLTRTMLPISITAVSPFAGGLADATTATAATRAVTLPITNLCIAQRLRSHSPGASSGDALLLSAADQRELLALTKERAQMAMLQFALLGRVFATAPLSDPGPVSKVVFPGTSGYPLSFIPMLQQWAQSGTATETVLRTLGQDFAGAVQLQAVAAHELVDLLSRSGSARLPRGGNASDPSWAVSGRLGSAAVEVWGPGAWRERAMAALYGGDPLVEDSSGSTPWEHFLDSKSPGGTGSEKWVDWPDVNDASFVSTRLKDPKLQELYGLALRGDAIYLSRTGSWVVDPLSQYQCRDVDVPSSSEQLYRLTEAYVRTSQCTTFDPVTETCRQYVVNDIPASAGFASFDLWQKYRISPEHASALAGWLKDMIPKECQRTRSEISSAGVLSPTTITFWNRGALDFDGEIETSGAAGEYYHLINFHLRPRLLRETAGLYSRYSGFWIPSQISPSADPSTQGFSVGAVAGASIVGAPPDEINWSEEMRLMGAIPALAVTRDALVKAAADAAILPTSARTLVDAFLEQKQSALAVIEGEIGKDGVSITPANTLSTSNVTVTVTIAGVPIAVTLQRTVLTPTYASQNVEVTYAADDAFWSAGSHTLIAIPDEPLATSVAAHPGSKAFGRAVADIVVNPRGKSGALIASALPPAGTVTSNAQHVTLAIPRSDEQWSFIVQRQVGATVDYKSIASHIRKFSLATTNVGQYLAFNGALSDVAAGVMAKEMNDPAMPAFDGFGLPNQWLPPTDPALFGGSSGEDAVRNYLDKAKASAAEATAAVKDAFETMLHEQQDEAALAAAVSNGEKVAAIERSALCGSANCDTSLVSAPSQMQAIWAAAPSRVTLVRPTVGGPIVATPAPARTPWQDCLPAPHTITVAGKLKTLAPAARLDCLALIVLGKADASPLVLAPVLSRRLEPATPAFEEYAGGTLQSVAIEQWTSLRVLEDGARAFIAAADAAIGRVDLYEHEFQESSDEDKEMRARCGNLEALAVNQICGSDSTCKTNYCGNNPDPACKDFNFSDLTWEDESSASYSKSNYTTTTLVKTDIFGNTSTVDQRFDPDGTSTGTSGMSLGAMRRLCESYKDKVETAQWQLNDAVLEAYADIESRISEFTEAMGRVQAASASALALKHQTELAIARNDLEVSLLRDSQVTSFGLFRQLHSYDAWRAKSLLDGARLSAAVARKAIESRYVVNLSELTSPEPLVASPSTWADEIYGYDLDMPSAVGLTVGEAVPGGIYSNKVLDYVSNLENFVNGYSIARPTAVAHNDAEVVSLPGPRGLDSSPPMGTDLPDGRALAWSYFCPSGPNAGWRPSPPDMNPSEACGAAPARPTRAKLLFALDPWGRLHGDIADEPFERRYNARWSQLALNLVGTGVLDCSKAADPDGCYTQPFVRYQLTHRGIPWITDADQSWTILPAPVGNIEGAKALAAEQWLDPIVNGWAKPYVASVARNEFSVRPLGGTYEAEFELGPEVVLERIERVQLLMGTSYWVSQGQSFDPPPVAAADSGVVNAFDPGTLALTSWWRDYPGSVPWAGSSSAGGSSAPSLTNGGPAIGSGSPLNGHGTAAMVQASSDYFAASTTASSLFSATAFSGWALVNVSSIATNSSAYYLNDSILCSAGSSGITVFLKNSGVVGLGIFNGTSNPSVTASLSTNAWQLVQYKSDGINLFIRINSGAWQSAAGGAAASISATLEIGRSPGTEYMNGVIAELGTSNLTLSDADFDNIKAYVNARYALSL